MAGRILVVEDEPAIRMGLTDVLTFQGFDVTAVGDGTEGLREALRGGYQLLLLDVMLPGVDGFTICSRAREAWPQRAILLLTARGSEEDILEGFRRGADDYVAKPFSVAQLVARVRALTRRSQEAEARISLHGVELDRELLTATAGSARVELSPRDLEVLELLLRQPGRPVRRSELLEQVWGFPSADGVHTRCVDMHVAKLRRKLRPLGAAADLLIETVRGVGYRTAAPS